MLRGQWVFVWGLSFVMGSVAMAADPAPKAAPKVAAPTEATAPQTVVPSPAVSAPDAGKPVETGKEVVAKKELPQAELPYGKRNPLLPFLQFGPKLNLILFPALGLEVRTFNWVSASFDYFMIPSLSLNMSGSQVGLGMNAWWAGLRFHPMRGSFFIGADMSGMNVSAGRDFTFSLVGGLSETRNISLTAAMLQVTPMLGWRWVTQSGFFTGLELGASITYSAALNPTVERKADDNTYQIEGTGISLPQEITNKENELRDNLQPIADIAKRFPLPHIRFLIGFLF